LWARSTSSGCRHCNASTASRRWSPKGGCIPKAAGRRQAEARDTVVHGSEELVFQRKGVGTMRSTDTFNARGTLDVDGKEYEIYRLKAVANAGFDVSSLPYSLTVLLGDPSRPDNG